MRRVKPIHQLAKASDAEDLKWGLDAIRDKKYDSVLAKYDSLTPKKNATDSIRLHFRLKAHCGLSDIVASSEAFNRIYFKDGLFLLNDADASYLKDCSYYVVRCIFEPMNVLTDEFLDIGYLKPDLAQVSPLLKGMFNLQYID